MTTTATPTAGPILATDLGKYKCVACRYDTATAAAEYRTVTTARAEVGRLIRDARPAAVVACMRKLVMICYGVLKNRAAFDPSGPQESPLDNTLPCSAVA